MSDWLLHGSRPTRRAADGSRPARPTRDDPPPVGEDCEAASERLAADGVDDEVDAPPVGELADLVGDSPSSA